MFTCLLLIQNIEIKKTFFSDQTYKSDDVLLYSAFSYDFLNKYIKKTRDLYIFSTGGLCPGEIYLILSISSTTAKFG